MEARPADDQLASDSSEVRRPLHVAVGLIEQCNYSHVTSSSRELGFSNFSLGFGLSSFSRRFIKSSEHLHSLSATLRNDNITIGTGV